MVAQTNHQRNYYAAKNKFDTVICLQMGKTSKVKTLPGDFKVTTLENPLFSQQAVTRNLSTLYQPTVEPLPQYLIRFVL